MVGNNSATGMSLGLFKDPYPSRFPGSSAGRRRNNRLPHRGGSLKP